MKLSQLTAPCKAEYVENGKRYLLEVNIDEFPTMPMSFQSCYYFTDSLSEYSNIGTRGDLWGSLVSVLVTFGIDYEGDNDEQELMQILANTDSVVFYPLFCYSHSGMCVSAKPFNDKWDSGFCGFVVYSKSAVEANYSTTDKWREIATNIILNEIEQINYCLNGEVYMYKLSRYETVWDELTCPHCGEVIKYNVHEELIDADTCYGFYGANLAENGMMDYLPDVEVTEVK
uniref:Zinc ribbon domain protein n=1 Tax=Siphoviridae sp. ctv4j104 TaxID=2826510 RepID=A0A8S5M9W5_9CAUD|nr:MAG TPA: zinc ribbon domain protein [Siphoviridae sp. ctv4j104]